MSHVDEGAWIGKWNKQINATILRLAGSSETGGLAVEMLKNASQEGQTIERPGGQVVPIQPMLDLGGLDDALRGQFSTDPDAWVASLDEEQARFLSQRLKVEVSGKRRGPVASTPGHIRVLLVRGRHATVNSLVVRCGLGNAATDHLAELYPAVRRANAALVTVQEDLIPGSASLPRDVNMLLYALGRWSNRSEVKGEPFAELRSLLAQAGRASPLELREVQEAAIDIGVQVGDPDTEADARSIELPFVLAATSAALGCAAADSLVVATGAIELATGATQREADIQVRRVGDFDKKQKAVLAWAKALGRRVVFIHPRGNHERLTGPEGAEWNTHVRSVPVQTLGEAWQAIPRQRPWLWTGTEHLFAAAIAIWYFERLVLGEYAGDPATVEKLGWSQGVVPSTIAAVVMAGLFLFDVLKGPYLESARVRRMLSLSYLPFACVVMFLFIATGAIDFPTHTEFMKNKDAESRRMWVWKDIAVMYPLVLVFFSAFWRVTRADAIADVLRRGGFPWAARDAIEEANDTIGQMVRKSYPYLAAVYVVGSGSLIGYDFFWYGQQPHKTFSTWCMIAHIIFQVGWGFVCFGFAPVHLRAPQRRLVSVAGGEAPSA